MDNDLLWIRTIITSRDNFSGDLDKRFGKRTLAAKITDVPGETISAIHILNENGIRMLHVGVNVASTRPDTPPVFLWRDPQGGEIVVVYENNYGGTTQIPGFNQILQFAFSGDNEGPQTPEEVKEFYQKMKEHFPGAVIMTSTLNNYASCLWKIRDKLPVLTFEIGNTWIHSAESDPMKYAGLRTLMRLREKWLNDKLVNPEDPKFKEFSTYLILLTEHTGGIDEKLTIDFDHYTVEELASVIKTPPYQRMMQSWNDARAYVTKAVNALGNSPFAKEAKKDLSSLIPQKPDLNGFAPFSLNKKLQTKNFEVKIDPFTGAINELSDRNSKQILMDSSVPFGLFWHESFSEDDYIHWADQYRRIKKMWVFRDFCKPNVGQHGAVSTKRLPKVIQLFIKKQENQTIVLLKLQMDEVGPTHYGLPSEVWVQLEFPLNPREINYEVQWFGKQACRLPESYWFSIGISSTQPQNWSIEKMDRLISPTNVVFKGGRNLHAFNRGVFYTDGIQQFSIISPDCPIVAQGNPSLLDFNDQLPDMKKGWHFNLFNNKWGTNFPIWYSDDAKFRFTIQFE